MIWSLKLGKAHHKRTSTIHKADMFTKGEKTWRKYFDPPI
uniref:Uncharacterized protein n=1 Tax=Rhizophora mucronata TaxID=61149 RepID=A0A2P2PNQ7_RHIMU